MSTIKIPMFSIAPGQISFYDAYHRTRLFDHNYSQNSLSNLEKNKPGLNLSSSAKKRLKLAIDWLLYLSKPKRAYNKSTGKKFSFNIAFVTLTLSSKQVHTDLEIKSKLFNTFLVHARRTWGVKNYVWRAEKQGNGNLHFHLLIDRYVPWWELREAWNRIQDVFNYCTSYTDRFKNMTFDNYCQIQRNYKGIQTEKMRKAYNFGRLTKWKKPNSTDIHSVVGIKNLAAYLVDYCTKKSKHGAVEGAQWRLSQSLSRYKKVVEIVVSKFHHDLDNLFDKYKDRVKVYEYATILYVNLYEIMDTTPLSLMYLVDSYVLSCDSG